MDSITRVALITGALAHALTKQNEDMRRIVLERKTKIEDAPIIFTPHIERDPRTKGQRRHERRQQLRSVMK